MIFSFLLTFLILLGAEAGQTTTRVAVEGGLQRNDIIQWTGTVNRAKNPTYFFIRADFNGEIYNMLKLQIHGFWNRIVVTNRLRKNIPCVVGPALISRGSEFNIIVVARVDRFLIYLDGILKYVHKHAVNGPTIEQVTMISTYNSVGTRELKVLSSQEISDILSMPGCGQSRLDIPAPAFCDNVGPIHRKLRIVGGVDSKPGSQPWQVAMRYKPEFSSQNEHICGGTLISNCWVVSAAHCFSTISQSALRRRIIRIGDYFNRDGTPYSNVATVESSVDVDIAYVITHDKYFYNEAPENDVALIRLAECIEFDTFKLPACLPTERSQFRPGTFCGISGWGALNSSQFPSEYPACLQNAEVTIKSDRQCSASLGKKYLSKKMICANTGTTDTCQGDSGGPLVCNFQEDDGTYRHYLWGITSWGEGCGVVKKPGAYTRVSTYLKWIYMNTRLRPPVGAVITPSVKLQPQINESEGCLNYQSPQ